MCGDWAANANSCSDRAAGNRLISVKYILGETSVHIIAPHITDIRLARRPMI